MPCKEKPASATFIFLSSSCGCCLVEMKDWGCRKYLSATMSLPCQRGLALRQVTKAKSVSED